MVKNPSGSRAQLAMRLSERSPLAEYRRYPYGSLYKSYPYYASARRSAKVLTFDVDYDIINSSINKNLTEIMK